MSLDDIKKLRAQFLDVIDGAIANLENGVGIDTVGEATYISFSKDVDNKSVNELLTVLFNNYERIRKGEHIYNIDAEVLEKKHKRVSENILEYFNSIGNIAHNDEIGNVDLVKSGAKTTVTKGFSDKKASAVGAIKDVIENGTIIDRQSNWKNRSYDTVVIAGKGTLYGEDSIMGIVIKTYPNHKNLNAKFYLHEIIEIKEADLYKQTAPQLSVDAEHKSTSNNSIPKNTPNVKKSLDVDSEGRKLSDEQIKRYRNIAPELRDENGRIKPFYHGTPRADRVGNYFNPDRATSGPMTYFTDNANIAGNYSRDKSDTSIAYDNDYDSYETQFRINGKSIVDYWYTLSSSKKRELTQKIKQVTLDDDDNIILKSDNEYGIGNFNDYELHMANGNALQVLVDGWLNGGTLWNEENRFIEVLDSIGIKNVEYKDPNYREEKVYKVYLNVTNPFKTSKIDDDFISDLEDYVASADMSIYDTEDLQADMWDKNSIEIDYWIERLKDDLKNGTTHAWTSIPDVVTDFLKEYGGYNGIVDKGGKNGGEIHTVVIPFYSNQIKNVDNTNPTDNIDIRYSIDVDDYWNDSLLVQNQKLKKAVEYYKQQALTTQTDFKRKDVRKIAVKLKSEYASKINVDELTDSLLSLYTDLGNDRNTPFETWQKIAADIARKIIYNQREDAFGVNQEAQDVLNDLKAYTFTLTDEQREELRYHMPMSKWSNTIRKGARYTVKNNGLPLEAAWQEWSEHHPEWFDADTAAEDMPVKLYEITEALNENRYNDLGISTDEYAEYLSLEIFKEFDNLTPIETIADKEREKRLAAEYALKKFKKDSQKEFEKRIAAINESHSAAMKGLSVQHRQEIAALKATWDGKVERRIETAEKIRLRKSIERNTVKKD